MLTFKKPVSFVFSLHLMLMLLLLGGSLCVKVSAM